MSEARWSLIVHGGARTIASDQQERNRRGCAAAARIGAAVLQGGGTAIDAVERAVCQLEDDDTFNAGSGSVATAGGHIEMDAAIMDGTTLEIGAVAAIRRVRHPVSVARLLLAETPVLLVAEGAQAFAAARGVESHDGTAAVRSGRDHDTVGCVARDRHGNLAVATSTGGLTGQMQGRVGDAPIPGCGFYANNDVGAAALSGDGESIMRILLAARVMQQLERGAAAVAVAAAMRQLDRLGGEAGIIALDKDGGFGIAHNSAHFAVALAASWLSDAVAGVHQNEFEGYDLHG